MSICAASFTFPRLRAKSSDVSGAWGLSAPKSIQRIAVPAWDEDAITQGAAAARLLTQAPAYGAAPIRAVYFVSGAEPTQRSAPLTMRGAMGAGGAGGASGAGSARAASGAATIAAYLGLEDVETFDVTGGPHAAVATLAHALARGLASGDEGAVILIAAEIGVGRHGTADEPTRGAGAAAFLLAPGPGATCVGSAAATGESMGDTPPLDTSHKLARDAITSILERWPRTGTAAQGPPAIVPEWVACAPEGSLPPTLAKAAEASAPAWRADVGLLGCAFLAEFAHVLGRASVGDRVLLAGAEPGQARALAFRLDGPVTLLSEPIAAKEIPYLRSLQERGAVPVELPTDPMGAFVSPTTFLADLDARYGLVGRRCPDGHVHFPPRSACPRCASGNLTPLRLAGDATLLAYTVIGRGASPGEFAPEQAAVGEYVVGLVEFPEGPRLTVRLTEFDRDQLAIGAHVRAVFRRLYEQQGAVRYGLKFRPAVPMDHP
ncbi:MAG: OB-fold domain-containing protein [Thermoplasmatota archaeon]